MRKTILLILIAAGLGAYVYFYEIKGGEQRAKEKSAAEKLVQFNKDSIDYIAIQSPFSSFEFERKEDGWQIIKPVQTGADQSPLNTLISGLANAKKQRSFAVAENERAGFGLNNNSMHIKAKTGSTENFDLQFGDASSIGSNIYVTLGDSMVHLVPASVAQNARKSLFQWRDKKALHLKKDEVRTIRYRHNGVAIELQKEGSDWQLTKPLKSGADKSVVDGLINKLVYGTVGAVVSETPDQVKKYRLKRPATEIELLIGADKASKKIIFSSLKANEAFGRDLSRPHIFRVDSTFMKPLTKSLFDFRDKTVFNFEQQQVNRIVVNYEDLKLELQKDTSNTWYTTDSVKAKSWRVTSWLSAVKNLKAASFEVPARMRRAKNADGTLQLFKGTDMVAHVQVWASDAKRVFVKNADTGLVVAAKAKALKNLFPKRDELLEAKTKEKR